MGLDVWFREDVWRVLQAARVSGREAQLGPLEAEQSVVVSREMTAYWRGYEAALATIGAAFGLAAEIGASPARLGEKNGRGMKE